MRVYVEWPDLREDMLADIRAARQRIWLEAYIFYNDDGGTQVADALAAKAREGLDVRVMYDAFGSQTTPASFFQRMTDAGVKVHVFHSFWESLRRLAIFSMLNRRNHRKLMVIDEDIGYFGGMNVVDNTEETRTQQNDLPQSAGWRDVHMRMQGPQTRELAEEMDRMWRRAHHEKLPRRSLEARRRLRGVLKAREQQQESIRFFASDPRLPLSRAARAFTALLRRANDSIYMSMAYFVPLGRPMRALLRARRRGARVRVVVPGKSDMPVVQRCTEFLYTRLLRRGFRIYERKDRMLHSKVMVVDRQWSLVGSCNFDPRALYTNHEFLAVIRSRALADILIRVCRDEIKQSRRVTLAMCAGRTWMDRLKARMAWSLRWWL